MKMPRPIPDLSADEVVAFWSHVQRSEGCWEWTAGRNGTGQNRYGRWAIKREGAWIAFPAHRVALQIATGVVLLPDQLACHHCDNPPCCRPDHLYVGTHLTNARDMFERGRHPSPLLDPLRPTKSGGRWHRPDNIRRKLSRNAGDPVILDDLDWTYLRELTDVGHEVETFVARISRGDGVDLHLSGDERLTDSDLVALWEASA